jgi:hypothetical protein
MKVSLASGTASLFERRAVVHVAAPQRLLGALEARCTSSCRTQALWQTAQPPLALGKLALALGVACALRRLPLRAGFA